MRKILVDTLKNDNDRAFKITNKIFCNRSNIQPDAKKQPNRSFKNASCYSIQKPVGLNHFLSSNNSPTAPENQSAAQQRLGANIPATSALNSVTAGQNSTQNALKPVDAASAQQRPKPSTAGNAT